MNHFKFQKLIKDVPSIEVSLNWYHDQGQGNFEKEFKSSSLTAFTNFSCYETGILDYGDYNTEPSFVSDGLDIDEIEFNVYDENGSEIKLTTGQKEKLSNTIKSNIISN